MNWMAEGTMFKEPLNFALQRTPIQAIGWYLFFAFVTVLFGLCVGGVALSAFGTPPNVHDAIKLAERMSFTVPTLLGIGLISQRPLSPLNFVLFLLALALSPFAGFMLSGLLLSYLTTRPPKWSPVILDPNQPDIPAEGGAASSTSRANAPRWNRASFLVCMALSVSWLVTSIAYFHYWWNYTRYIAITVACTILGKPNKIDDTCVQKYIKISHGGNLTIYVQNWYWILLPTVALSALGLATVRLERRKGVMSAPA